MTRYRPATFRLAGCLNPSPKNLVAFAQTLLTTSAMDTLSHREHYQAGVFSSVFYPL